MVNYSAAYKNIFFGFAFSVIIAPFAIGAQKKDNQQIQPPVEINAAVEEIPEAERIKEDKSKELLILFTNSTNGYLESCGCPMRPAGGLYRVAPYIDEMRKQYPHMLVLDSGDICPPYAPDNLVKLILKAYKRIKYDVVGLGDQELSSKKFCDWLPKSGVPFIGPDIEYNRNKKFVYLSPNVKIFQKNGAKIAVISVIEPEALLYYPETITNRLKITPPDEFLTNFFSKSEKYDLVVLISHSGLEKNKEFAKKFSGIGIIIGGHQYNHLSMPSKIGEALIVQAGSNAQHVGKLTLIFDDNRKWKLYDYDIKALTKDLPLNPYILGLSEQYKKQPKIWNNK